MLELVRPLLKNSSRPLKRHSLSVRALSTQKKDPFAALTAWYLERKGRFLEVNSIAPGSLGDGSHEWATHVSLRGAVGEGGEVEKGIVVKGSRKDFHEAQQVAGKKSLEKIGRGDGSKRKM